MRSSNYITIHHLTQRELEVLALIAEGMTNREIAEELVLTRKTVDNHVGHILNKLNVPNRLMAVLVAQQRGDLPLKMSSLTHA